jgi:hypothetical protein
VARRLRGAVIAGAAVGSRYGLAGVAVGVSAAIAYMFVACGHLALKATGATWAEYFQAQRGGLFASVVAGGVALSTRLLLEASGASSGAIALAVAAPRRYRGPPAWSGWWLVPNASRCGNGCRRGARGLSRPWARVERLARSHDEGA